VEISRLQRKEKYFKNTKTTAIRPKNGKLLAIIFVVFKYQGPRNKGGWGACPPPPFSGDHKNLPDKIQRACVE
jgi:hypothetical protein